MEEMMLFLAADHAGFNKKEQIKKILEKEGYQVKDFSPFLHDGDDYPALAFAVGRHVAMNSNSKGILFCGTGVGMAIAANKVVGIRAASVSSVSDAKLSREHNDSNVLALSGHVSALNLKKIVNAWLKTQFSNAPRHARRLKSIEMFERSASIS